MGVCPGLSSVAVVNAVTEKQLGGKRGSFQPAVKTPVHHDEGVDDGASIAGRTTSAIKSREKWRHACLLAHLLVFS